MKDDAIGREVDGYRIEGVLGRGGMGVVYKGTDVALSRPVALKRINPGQAHREAFLHRFRAEARALARINSPNIVSIYALRETDIGLLIVMEYVDGGTISDRIEGPMAAPAAIPFLQQILSAFDDAHRAEVIHRDIKPQNLLLTQDDVVKVTDFGIAKMRRQDSGETMTQGGQGGTLKYMSPEQISDVKAVDNRSDLYSIGMTAYQMLTGQLPFGGTDTDFDIMRKVVEGSIPSPGEVNPALPKPLVSWLIKSIQKQPADRFQEAGEMADALEDAVARIDRSDLLTSDAGDDASGELDGPTVLDDKTRLDQMSTVMDEADAPTQTSMADADALPDASEEATIMDADETTLDKTLLDETALEDTGPTAPDSPASSAENQEQDQGREAAEPGATPARPRSGSPDEPAAGSVSSHEDSHEEAAPQSGSLPWGQVAAAVAGVLLAAIGYWMTVPSESASPTAALSLQSAPAGATVMINGDSVGTTPLQNHTLAAGPLTLTLRKPGHAAFDTTFRAHAGEVYRLSSVQLASTTLASTTDSRAAPGREASVQRDPQQDAEPRASGTSSAAPRTDDTRVDGASTSSASTNSATDDARADAGSDRTSAEAPRSTSNTAASDGASATLAFDVQPSGALYVNGNREGASGQLRVPAGTQRVSCRNPSYGRIDTTLTVRGGTTESVSCYFEQEVNVTAIGGWGNIWLNGENTGRRTGAGNGVFRLPPGTHTFSLPIQRSGTETTGIRYQVRAGDTVTQRRSLDGSEITIRVRPSFTKMKHAVVFQVTTSGS